MTAAGHKETLSPILQETYNLFHMLSNLCHYYTFTMNIPALLLRLSTTITVVVLVAVLFSE